MNISLIIDARLTGKDLSCRLTQARQQIALFQGRSEIIVIDDGGITSEQLGEHAKDYRLVRVRPAPMGRRFNLAASHSNGRMLGFCLGPLDSAWVERMMAAAARRITPHGQAISALSAGPVPTAATDAHTGTWRRAQLVRAPGRL